MQPEHLHVGQLQAGLLERRENLRERRAIATRENVFTQPRVGHAGAVPTGDEVDQGDAVLGQQVAHLLEELSIMLDPDMFEHADRNDPVVRAGFLAIVLQAEAHAVGQRLFSGAFRRYLLLLDREGHSRDVGARFLGDV